MKNAEWNNFESDQPNVNIFCSLIILLWSLDAFKAEANVLTFTHQQNPVHSPKFRTHTPNLMFKKKTTAEKRIKETAIEE